MFSLHHMRTVHVFFALIKQSVFNKIKIISLLQLLGSDFSLAPLSTGIATWWGLPCYDCRAHVLKLTRESFLRKLCKWQPTIPYFYANFVSGSQQYLIFTQTLKVAVDNIYILTDAINKTKLYIIFSMHTIKLSKPNIFILLK